MIKKSTLFIFFMSQMLSIAFSAPIISSVSGILLDGNTITIQGSGFGASGPNIVLFSDFEEGPVGTTVKIGPGSAKIGQWTSYTSGLPYRPVYDSSAKVSGNLSLRADNSLYWSNGINFYFPSQVTVGQEIYASWWLYIPAGDWFPGEAASETNWKQFWFMRGDRGDDLVVPTQLVGSWYINGTSPYKYWLPTEFNSYFIKGRWSRFSAWVRLGNASNGAFQFSAMALNALNEQQWVNNNNVTILATGNYWDHIGLNDYGRASNPCHPTFDDIYIATGANARARVEIGSHSTYNASTKLAVSTINSWSDNVISATIRQGNFLNGSQAYLYVFDANGVVNVTGYPVTINSSLQILLPPTNLRIIQ